ncbi:hypothetical protein FRC11_002501, partial [Ceratobasidium sp. 423]
NTSGCFNAICLLIYFHFVHLAPSWLFNYAPSLGFIAAGSLCLAAPASLTERAAASPGTFAVLSMNVAGMPTILNPNDESGNNTTNTMYVGQDFNYHATLYQYDTRPFRTTTSGGVPFASGLNAITKHDWVDFSHIKWDQCRNASESDCLTPKVGTTRFNFDSRQIDMDLGIYLDADSNRQGCL